MRETLEMDTAPRMQNMTPISWPTHLFVRLESFWGDSRRGEPIPHGGAVWSDQHKQEHFHDVFAPPVILEKANASNCYAAVNDIFAAFSISTIIKICLVVKCMLYCEVPDAVGYIRRAIFYKATQLPRNCIYPLHTCVAHRLHRIFVNASDEDSCQRCSKRYSRQVSS